MTQSAPENTLLAFQHAIDYGCERVELDVRLTRDQRLVVIHDADIEHTTNGSGLVDSMILSEIQSFSCAQDQRIPTMQEVLDLCSGHINLQIELKAPGTAMALVELLHQRENNNDVLITSFTYDYIQAVQTRDSHLAVGWLVREESEAMWSQLEQNQLTYLCPKGEIITQTMVEQAHALQMKVYAYHVNDKALADQLLAWGVDDIGTDHPEWF